MPQPRVAQPGGHAPRSRQASRDSVAFLLLAVILLASTVLRLRALDASPLWWDEGNNAYFAHCDLAELVEGCRITHDTDPPTHRLALRFWLALVGDSAYNLRLLSVVCGVATVALVYVWGRRRGGAVVGAVAALLAGFSPFALYFTREAKGYPFATFFCTVAMFLWIEYLDGREDTLMGWRRTLGWVIYVVSSALALGAHYYIVFAIVAQGIWLLVDAGARHDGRLWSRLWRWTLAQAVVAALLAPWVWVTLDTSLGGARNVPLPRDAYDLLSYVRHVTGWLAVGPHGPAWTGYLVAAVVAVACGAALWFRRWHAGALVCLVAVPVACCYGAQRIIPFFWARFLLYVTPPLFVLVAEGLVALQRVGLVLATLLLVAWAVALPTVYIHFVGPEEDLRPIARAIREQAQPGDVISVGYIWQEGVLRMELSGDDLSYVLGWYTPETVGDDLARLLDEHSRLWLITYRAPMQHAQNPGGFWLERNAVRLVHYESGHSRAMLYVAAPACEAEPVVETVLGDALGLRASLCTPSIRLGEPVVTQMTWTVRRRSREPLSVFLHVYDASGKLVTQRDGPPRHGLMPFGGELGGGEISEWRGVLLPNDALPGRYSVVVGVYGRASGQRLFTSDGRDALFLGTVVRLPDFS